MSERALAQTRVAARATFLPVLSPEHAACERALLELAPCYPVPHRVAWLEHLRAGETLFCAASDVQGRWAAGFPIQMTPSRALPGHQLLRVERYTPPSDPDVQRAMLQALRDLVLGDRRILRLGVELHCRDEGRRLEAERQLSSLGFRPSGSSRSYEQTLALDLRRDEAALLAGMHATARRHIRAVAKHPVEVRAIEDPAWADRIDALLRESMSRTGGAAVRHDWSARIEFSRRCPDLSRIVGLFRTDVGPAESLLAFAWGCNHGEYAHYDAAGATRSSGLRLPLAYALMWDLIVWAKRSARWFDLGGVTPGHLNDGEDALGGISDFKRFFTREVVQVGAEWVLEPRRFRARLARVIGAAVARFRGRAGRQTA